MIQLQNILLPPDTDFSDIAAIAAKTTGLSPKSIHNCRLIKRSVDARKKPMIQWVCTIEFETDHERQAIYKSRWRHTTLVSQKQESIAIKDASSCCCSPIIVGSGPAGLFAALILVRAGCHPIVLERGEPVEQRMKTVEKFWTQGVLQPNSNVQFGEGGAGTFSDGKLNTGTKDPRNRFVLETFAAHGAPEEILYEAKPHIGTDRLVSVVKSIRNEIEKLGGQVFFEHCFTDILLENGRLAGITVQTPAGEKQFSCRYLITALGHSARDTVRMLWNKGLHMQQKPFSVGVRIEHLQKDLNRIQYGSAQAVPPLPAADYKASTHLPDGRGVYTFCMCPGGQVVASASEIGSICTNGMSLFARDGQNANSALLVGVGPGDFENDHPLAGIGFQETIEKAAFAVGGSNYAAPVQLVGDFLNDQLSASFGTVQPTYRPGVTFCRLEQYLPPVITHSLRQALPALEKKLPLFGQADAVLTGPETRSSSPVRMVRDEQGQSNITGIYPCGEGAGYAGGITSAAADGIRTAQQVIEALLRK